MGWVGMNHIAHHHMPPPSLGQAHISRTAPVLVPNLMMTGMQMNGWTAGYVADIGYTYG